jgi:ketosteroid isomerase-like protein
MQMTRSPQEVFSDHLQALVNRDISALIEDYSADALILTQQGALDGTAGADQFYRQAFEVLPDAEFTVKWTVFGGDSLLAAWTATASAGHVDDGVDTLSFTDGTIRLHASFFTITPNETADSAR